MPVGGGMEGESDQGEGVELHHQTPPLLWHRREGRGEGRMHQDEEGEGGERHRDL